MAKTFLELHKNQHHFIMPKWSQNSNDTKKIDLSPLRVPLIAPPKKHEKRSKTAVSIDFGG